MYRRESSGWGKHYDFIILDLICLQLALLLSYVIRGLGYNPYVNILYRRLGIFLIFADMAVIFTFDTFKNVNIDEVTVGTGATFTASGYLQAMQLIVAEFEKGAN